MNSTLKEGTPLKGKSIFAFAILLILVGVSRHLPLDYPNLFNFSPVLAIFLVAGAYLKGKFSYFIPLLAVFLSDLTLSKNYGTDTLEPFMFVTLSSYLLIFFIGRKICKSHSLPKLLGTGIVSALIFHIITCSFSWMVNPAYLKSPTGWIQSIFIGEPGYAPSYLFLRNSMLSTVLFTLVFAYTANFLREKQRQYKPLKNATDPLLKAD
jgi:hypothetical protein